MLKVIIADDEDKICQLIYRLVNWESLDMSVVGIGHNGIEALELVMVHKPEIVITDIRMPGYDGLEFIEKANELNPMIQFIIISGYQHFSYAQRAIKYGVSDYLLKPIKKEELVGALTKMRNYYLERAEQLSKEEQLKINLENNIGILRQSFFPDILFQRVKSNHTITIEMINREYKYNFSPGLFQIVTIKLDSAAQSYNSNVRFLEEKVEQIISTHLTKYCYDMGCYIEDSICYAIINCSKTEQKSIRKKLKSLLDEITLTKGIVVDMDCTIGLGTIQEDVSNIYDSLRTAILAYEQRLVYGTNRVIEYDFSSSSNLVNSDLFYEFNKEMNGALERLDIQGVNNAIRYLREEIKKRPDTSGHEVLQMTKEVCNVFLFFMRKNKLAIEGDDSFLDTFNNNAKHYGSINQLFHYLTQTITNTFEKAIECKRELDSKPIRDAKTYIQENYARPIKLEDISELVGFNANYFSSLFKKDTGYTFLEYLSEVRMNKAKELLKETNISIASVCEQVGYSDMKHFNKMFIKHTALKPNEFRKLYS